MSMTSASAASATAPAPGDAVLSARNVSKTYGNTHALKGVNFDIHRGKVTTLFGENGAGKSTLMKILSGVVTPTAGEIVLDGRRVTFASTVEARDNGISIIHQELSLAPNLSVRDNIFLGRELRRPSGIDFDEEARQTKSLMEDLEEEIDPMTPVEELRLGQQQLVEIARALSVDARILIMDEPTSALSAAEVEVLFKVIRDLTSRGVSIVYISHHLEEALQITDYAVVLRDGAITATAEARDIDLQWIVHHMVGDHYDRGSPPTGYEFGDVVLSASDICVADTARTGGLVVDHLSLDVRAGEIVCIYGLMGAGRTELLEAIAGRVPMVAGEVLLHGEPVAGLNIAGRIAKGLCLVPEDRQRDGLVQTMSVGENLSLASIGAFVKHMLTSRPRERALLDQSIRNVHIKTAGGSAAIGSLSGGNQQKVVIGKMLATHPKVILNGGIDLSVGSTLGLCGVIAGFLMQGVSFPALGYTLYPPVWVVVVLTCALGGFVGLINGVLVARFKVPAFVATLGVMYVARGVALLITNGLTYNNLGGRPELGNTGFNWLGFNRLLDVPIGVIVLAVVALIGNLVLTRTAFGRWLYASGGNERAAELSGVPVKPVQITVYVMSGVCAAIAGLILSSQLTSAGPTAGVTYELTAIAAVVIGGAALTGGRGTVRGTLLGGFVIGFLSDGLVIIGISSYWQTVFTGAVIVLAVLLNAVQYRKRRAKPATTPTPGHPTLAPKAS